MLRMRHFFCLLGCIVEYFHEISSKGHIYLAPPNFLQMMKESLLSLLKDNFLLKKIVPILTRIQFEWNQNEKRLVASICSMICENKKRTYDELTRYYAISVFLEIIDKKFTFQEIEEWKNVKEILWGYVEHPDISIRMMIVSLLESMYRKKSKTSFWKVTYLYSSNEKFRKLPVEIQEKILQKCEKQKIDFRMELEGDKEMGFYVQTLFCEYVGGTLPKSLYQVAGLKIYEYIRRMERIPFVRISSSLDRGMNDLLSDISEELIKNGKRKEGYVIKLKNLLSMKKHDEAKRESWKLMKMFPEENYFPYVYTLLEDEKDVLDVRKNIKVSEIGLRLSKNSCDESYITAGFHRSLIGSLTNLVTCRMVPTHEYEEIIKKALNHCYEHFNLVPYHSMYRLGTAISALTFMLILQMHKTSEREFNDMVKHYKELVIIGKTLFNTESHITMDMLLDDLNKYEKVLVFYRTNFRKWGDTGFKDLLTKQRKEFGKKSRNLCDFCGNTALKLMRCSRCKQVRYCSRSCQDQDWKSHKKECKNFKKNNKWGDKKEE